MSQKTFFNRKILRDTMPNHPPHPHPPPESHVFIELPLQQTKEKQGNIFETILQYRTYIHKSPNQNKNPFFSSGN
jgi:hypothetical protein